MQCGKCHDGPCLSPGDTVAYTQTQSCSRGACIPLGMKTLQPGGTGLVLGVTDLGVTDPGLKQKWNTTSSTVTLHQVRLQEGERFRFRCVREDDERHFSGWYQNEVKLSVREPRGSAPSATKWAVLLCGTTGRSVGSEEGPPGRTTRLFQDFPWGTALVFRSAEVRPSPVARPGRRRCRVFPRWFRDPAQPTQPALRGRESVSRDTEGEGREGRGGVRLNRGSGLGQLPGSWARGRSLEGAEPLGAGRSLQI
ncbi:hypothetical protein Cadr_000001443 [Camelus dromedarius]|uniref:Uncharacterized protein n=1 Tax=Camelus dromedarius TaxID=9838 RepID=A0A5N4EGL6_CAMDR|nr:hypothetical protein Cadr_000001443 [Camelus dromedarius]